MFKNLSKLTQKYCFAQENTNYLRENIFRMKHILSKNSMQYLYNVAVLGYPLASKIMESLNFIGDEQDLNKVYDQVLELIDLIKIESNNNYTDLKNFIYDKIRDSHLGHKKSFLKSYIEGAPRNLHTLYNMLTSLANELENKLNKEVINYKEVSHEPMLADYGEIERFVLEHGDKLAIKNLDSLGLVLRSHPELARKLTKIIFSFNRGHFPSTKNLKEEITDIIKNYMNNVGKSKRNFDQPEEEESIGLPRDLDKEKKLNSFSNLYEKNIKEIERLNKMISLMEKQKNPNATFDSLKERAQKLILNNLELEDKINELKAEL